MLTEYALVPLKLSEKQGQEGTNTDDAFDVFLSHNSKDKPDVRRLGEPLKEQGRRVWLDEWELAPENSWVDALEHIVTTCKSAVVCVGGDGLGPWEEQEISHSDLVVFVPGSFDLFVASPISESLNGI